MDITMQPGRYVIAVSGGVDSVVLLDLLTQLPGVGLIVAHYDHGIRGDSAEDRRLVQKLAKDYNLPFVYDEGHLGKDASEATARKSRYTFLHTVRKQSGAQAIITAHHQDDVIETAILNLLRGTGRKGLTSLRSHDTVIRPLLHIPKAVLIDYAIAHHLAWREDSTNTDQSYKRNYVRHTVVTKLTPEQRGQLLMYITQLHDLNHKIDHEITNQLHVQPKAMHIERSYFIQLPHDTALEVLAAWLRHAGVRDFDAKGLQRIVVAAKTLNINNTIDVNNRYQIVVGKQNLALRLRDR